MNLSTEEIMQVDEAESAKPARRVTRTRRKPSDEVIEPTETVAESVTLPDPATETPIASAPPEAEAPVMVGSVAASGPPITSVDVPAQMNGDRPRRDRQGRPDRPDRPRGDRPPRPMPEGESGENGQRLNGPRDAHPRPRPERRPLGPVYTVAELEAKTPEELFELARGFELPGYTRMKRPDLISKLLQASTEMEGNIFGDGVLEIIEDGFGFLRGQRFLPGHDDIYVSQSQIRRFGLRTGDRVSGQVRPPKDNEKFFSLLRVEAVNGVDPETARAPAGVRHADSDLPARDDRSRNARRTFSRRGCSIWSLRSVAASAV